MFDSEKARRVLLERLPADPKWAEWVDGVLPELAACAMEAEAAR